MVRLICLAATKTPRMDGYVSVKMMDWDVIFSVKKGWENGNFYNPYHTCMKFLPIYIWLIFMVNVGK